MPLLKAGLTLNDIEKFDQNELHGWIGAVKLHDGMQRRQFIEDLPHASIAFKNHFRIWKSEVTNSQRRLLVALGQHDQQKPRDNKDPKIAANWDLLSRAKGARKK